MKSECSSRRSRKPTGTRRRMERRSSAVSDRVDGYQLGDRMSYDLRVWVRKVTDLGTVLVPALRWTEREGVWVLDGRSWQITVCAPQLVEQEDIPLGAASFFPDYRHSSSLIWSRSRLQRRPCRRWSPLLDRSRRSSLA
jgi:hypothetical protein